MQGLLKSVPVATPFKAGRPTPKASLNIRSRARIVTRAAAEADVEAAPKERKAGPLAIGGTKTGDAAMGKDAGAATKAASMPKGDQQMMQIVDGNFRDYRWAEGRWVLSHPFFTAADGVTDWDKVIDVEITRRKLLEDFPIPSTNEEPVLFNTADIPWWAWVRRFHLPEAEKLNGRAAMVGYLAAGLVDIVSGAGLVDQQESFFGKVALHLFVFGILLIRSTSDLDKYKNLLDEATFYDKQWQATWDGVTRPSETESSK